MSDSEPLVSIVINNYNYGRFLRDAVDSALGQTYSNIEVVVVDDGSTDDSREAIASYGDRIIPVLKENGGQASAFNAGFAASRGELICLLDADDVWLPEKVRHVVNAAAAHPEAILIYHRMQPASANLQPIGKPFPGRMLRGDVSSRVRKSCGWWASAPTSGLCMRRAGLEKLGALPEAELRISADAFLLGLVPLLGKILGLQRCLALYRLHGSNDYVSASSFQKPPGAGAMARNVPRYEQLTAIINRRLFLLGSRELLDLADHWGYQLSRYRLGLPGHMPLAQLAWWALRFPGEPAANKRLRMFASVLLRGRAKVSDKGRYGTADTTDSFRRGSSGYMGDPRG